MESLWFDKEKMRENALERNDAQQIFEEYLEKFSKRKREFKMNEPLHGTINLGILEEKGYKNIKTIIFGNGSITDIRNIPEGIQTLYCTHNLLREVSGLPTTLIDLNVSHNMLTKLDLSKSVDIKRVHVSFNDLESFVSLPESLELLHCNNNRLQELDLKRNIHLKILHCSNNDKLRLENVPESVVDFSPPSNIYQHVSSEDSITKYTSETYKQELDTYFRIKAKYENKLRINRKEKKNKGILPSCIGCGKNVGMTFSMKNRKYQARCGGNPPCTWNIVVQRGNFVPRIDVMEAYAKDVQDMREKVIQQKLITLYRHMDDTKSSDIFQQQMVAYKSANAYFEELTAEYKNMFENEEKIAEINEKKLEINIALQRVKTALKNGELEEAVEIQYKEIQPLSQSIQRLQYEVMRMINKITNKGAWVNSILLQETVFPEKLEMNLDKGR